ncbi:MAG: glycosyltransferase family 39 protein [Acidimicrobiales bacterium]|nr:glycosyltransferase family 39 protein [Acidimicrobiales bacterium]
MSTSFRVRVGIVAALGLGVRLWAVEEFYRRLPLAFSDNFFYSVQANALADGKGFLDPFLYDETGIVEPSASHPPLYSLYLSIWSFLGMDTPTWHRVASCMLGIVTVVAVALVARRLAGDRAGIAAGAVAALFPPLWIVDGTIVAESLYAPVIAGVMLAGLRFAERPTNGRAVVLGLVIAAAALTRSEGLALLAFVALPLVLLLRSAAWRDRIRLFAVTVAACLTMVAPWTIRNLAAFEEPTPLAYGAGYVMKVGNCDLTYQGKFLGYWHYSCNYAGSMEPDMSVGERRAREQAIDYIGDNLERVPTVVAARVGRLWHVYRPFQGVDFDVLFERRGLFPSRAGLWGFYALVPLVAAGLWAVRRCPSALVVTGAMLFSATFSAALAFGITRYRIAGDVAIAVLAGIGIDWSLRRLRGRLDRGDAARDPDRTDTDGDEDAATTSLGTRAST